MGKIYLTLTREELVKLLYRSGNTSAANAFSAGATYATGDFDLTSSGVATTGTFTAQLAATGSDVLSTYHSMKAEMGIAGASALSDKYAGLSARLGYFSVAFSVASRALDKNDLVVS